MERRPNMWENQSSWVYEHSTQNRALLFEHPASLAVELGFYQPETIAETLASNQVKDVCQHRRAFSEVRVAQESGVHGRGIDAVP